MVRLDDGFVHGIERIVVKMLPIAGNIFPSVVVRVKILHHFHYLFEFGHCMRVNLGQSVLVAP